VSRQSLLEATLACVARYGLAKTTMEDVGREAGLSRATVYRYFPGGKDQLLAEVVAWQVGAFYGDLTRAVAGQRDFADVLVETLVFAHRAIEEHALLQKILDTEPERLLPMLTTESNRLLALVKQFLVLAMQRAPLRAGLDGDAAADYLARMLLSHIGAQGRWDLTDRAEVRKLVETQLLPGLLEQ
jgi:AcrR family transcriptional regulator